MSPKRLPPSSHYHILTRVAEHGVVEGGVGKCFTGKVGGECQEHGIFQTFSLLFARLSMLFYSPTFFSLSFTLPRKDNMRAIDPINVAEHNVQLQWTTRFQRYLRGLASGQSTSPSPPRCPSRSPPARRLPLHQIEESGDPEGTHPQRSPVPSAGLQPSNGQQVVRNLQPRNGTSEDPSLSQDPSSPDSLEDS